MAANGETSDSVHHLERDPIWERYGFDTFEDFREMVRKIRLRPEIDEDVANRFEPARKALLYSYFEYDLLEPAYDRALLTFEMALRRRYRGLHPDAENLTREAPDEPSSLAKLIDWAEETYLLEPIRQIPSKRDNRSEEHVAHTFRTLRNQSVAHPERSSRMGTMGIHTVWEIANTINHLYGDREIRRKRHLYLQRARTHLDKVFDDRAVLDAPAEHIFDPMAEQQRLLIFEAAALHCEEADGSYIVHFFFQPIFDPDKGPENEFSMPDPIAVRSTSWRRKQDALYITDLDGSTWTIFPPEKEENEQTFRQWREQLGESDYRAMRSLAGSTLGRIQKRLRSTLEDESASQAVTAR